MGDPNPKTSSGPITDAHRGLAPDPEAAAADALIAAARNWQPVYRPGTAHNHTPSGQWSKIQAEPVTVDFAVDQLCRHFEPRTVATKIATTYLRNHPLALRHLEHYLSGGGVDLVEDDNLEQMIRSDAGVRRLIHATIRLHAARGGHTVRGSVEVQQRHYEIEDHQFAFGAIDRLDFEVNAAAGWVRVWFQDRYEWHPVYKGLYTRLPGDLIRDNNCLQRSDGRDEAARCRRFLDERKGRGAVERCPGGRRRAAVADDLLICA